jgi:hypothetical protein
MIKYLTAGLMLFGFTVFGQEQTKPHTISINILVMNKRKRQLCKYFRHTVKYMFAYFLQFVLSGI